MKELNSADLITMPMVTASYVKSTFVTSGWVKWLPAGLVALFADMGGLFNELFFVVILLWACDLILGTLRAFHDPVIDIEWVKMYKSVLKLFVIGVGVFAIHYIEHLILAGTGVDTKGKLCVATLLVIGAAEAFSVLDNLVYFFPGLTKVASSMKEMLGKRRNGNGSN